VEDGKCFPINGHVDGFQRAGAIIMIHWPAGRTDDGWMNDSHGEGGKGEKSQSIGRDVMAGVAMWWRYGIIEWLSPESAAQNKWWMSLNSIWAHTYAQDGAERFQPRSFLPFFLSKLSFKKPKISVFFFAHRRYSCAFGRDFFFSPITDAQPPPWPGLFFERATYIKCRRKLPKSLA